MNFMPYTQKDMKAVIKLLAGKLLPNYHIASLRGIPGSNSFYANVTVPDGQRFKDVVINCDHFPNGVSFDIRSDAKQENLGGFPRMNISIDDFYCLSAFARERKTAEAEIFLKSFKEPSLTDLSDSDKTVLKGDNRE